MIGLYLELHFFDLILIKLSSSLTFIIWSNLKNNQLRSFFAEKAQSRKNQGKQIKISGSLCNVLQSIGN